MTDARKPTYDQLSALCAQMAAALDESNTLLGSMPIYKENPRCVTAITANRKALTAYRTLSPDPQWQRVPEGHVSISKEKLWLWRCLIGETDFIRARRVAGELDNLLGTEWNSEHPNPMETLALVPLEPTQDMLDACGPKPPKWDSRPEGKLLREECDKMRREDYIAMVNCARGEG